MKLSELERADQARRDLRQARDQQEALKKYRVISVSIAQGKTEIPEGIGSITLRSGQSGTGSLSCIGFPDDLASYLSLAIEQWIDNRVKDAEARLETLGVDLAA